MDIRKILRASLLPTGICLLLIVIYLTLQAIPMITHKVGIEEVGSISLDPTLDLINTIYLYLSVPLYIFVFFWAGMRAVKKFNLNAIEGGLVAGTSYLFSGLINLALGVILNLIVLSRIIGPIDFRSPEAVVAAKIVGDLAGTMGVAVSALCGIGILAIGFMINFIFGSFGGLVAEKKMQSRKF